MVVKSVQVFCLDQVAEQSQCARRSSERRHYNEPAQGHTSERLKSGESALLVTMNRADSQRHIGMIQWVYLFILKQDLS